MNDKTPLLVKIYIIPFVLAGLYVIFGRFFFEARQRADTYYGVTEERILIVTRWPSRKLKSLSLRTLSEMSLDQGANGSGTITFGPTNPFQHWVGASSWPGTGTQSAPMFDSIADAKAVYETIRTTQRSAA